MPHNPLSASYPAPAASSAGASSLLETQRGATFPYRFGVDLWGKRVIVYNTENNKVASYYPSELQRLAAADLDPHRHNLYAAAWEYAQARGM